MTRPNKSNSYVAHPFVGGCYYRTRLSLWAQMCLFSMSRTRLGPSHSIQDEEWYVRICTKATTLKDSGPPLSPRPPSHPFHSRCVDFKLAPSTSHMPKQHGARRSRCPVSHDSANLYRADLVIEQVGRYNAKNGKHANLNCKSKSPLPPPPLRADCKRRRVGTGNRMDINGN